MTYNRITAEIGESRRITTRPISYQYDTVQILMLTAADGVELPSYFQVDFCVIGDTDTVTIVGSLTGGAPIPDSLLQQGENLMAYLVLTGNESDVQTRYEITIPVNERPTRSGIEMTSEQQAQVDSLVAALNDGVERAEAASQAVQDMGVEAETLPEGSQATVEKTVDPDTGAVTLGFGIPEGRHGETGATPDIQIGTVTTGEPGSQAAASITGTREEPRLNLTIPQGPQGDAGVTSVNGKTGAVTLDATDVGAYAKPSGGIPKTDLDQSVQTSLGKADTALQSAPVTSVNNKTGAVVLSASDVGAKPASYEAPVSSVNEKTGAVVLDAGDIGYESTTVEDELGTINSALSSLSAVTEIIDTASGAIASFPDGSGLPMRSLVAQINPVQDLHGYDAPWPAGGGVNKFNEATVTFGTWVSSDGTVTSNSTCCVGEPIYITSGKCYVKAYGTTPYSVIIIEYASDDSFINRTFSTGASVSATLNANTAYVKVGTSIDGGTITATILADLKVVAIDGNTLPTDYSPYSNLCPISGWTGLSGQRTGNAQQWDEQYQSGYYNSSGVYVSASGQLCTKNKIPVAPNKEYYFGTTSALTVTSSAICFYDASEQFITRVFQGKGTFLTPANACFINVNFGAIYGGTYNNDLCINYPSTDTSYHAYTGEAISVSWQDTAGTVYGGTVDVVSGSLTVDRFEYSFTGNETFITNSVWGQYAFLYNTGTEVASSYQTQDYCKSSHFKVLNAASWGDLIPNYFMIAGSTYIGLGFDGTAEELKTWLASQANDNNPVQVICMLKTPQTYQLTPQEVDTLVGQNNVWVDTGDVSVTYQASIKGYIDKVLAS